MSNALADTEPVEGMISTQTLLAFFVCLPALAVISYACYVCSFFSSSVSRWEKAHVDALPPATRGRAGLRTNGPLTRSRTRKFLGQYIDKDWAENDK